TTYCSWMIMIAYTKTADLNRTFPQSSIYGPAGLPVGALAGVRSRRIFAVMLDFIVVSILSFTLWLVLLIATFGLTLLFLPPLFPFVAFFYNGLTVSGWRMGTPGMRAMDIEARLT